MSDQDVYYKSRECVEVVRKALKDFDRVANPKPDIATAVIELTREEAKEITEDMELGELTDEQWGAIVSNFHVLVEDLGDQIHELLTEICSRKHADTPTWMEDEDGQA